MKKVIISLLIFVIAYIILNQSVSRAETKKMKIVIDPGHGGYDTGAINYDNGILEKDITLKTARYLRDYLLKYYGVEVIMTHDGLPNDRDLEIVDRGMCARNNDADLLISVHFNADNNNQQSGAEVYVTHHTSCYKYNEESTQIGNLILQNLSSLGIQNRGVKTRLCEDVGPKWEYIDGSRADYYGVIRYAMKGDSEERGLDITKGVGITSILVEHCFLRGNDVKYINSDEKLKRLAEADGRAIVEHYGLRTKEEVEKEKINIIIQNGKSASVLKDNYLQLFKETGALDSKIIWRSSDESIATVTENGLVHGVKEGTVKITALLEKYNKEDTIELNVTTLEDNDSIEIEKYEEKDGVISGFGREILVEDFIKNIKLTGNLKIKVSTEKYVGSKTVIQIMKEDTTLQTYICKLKGDINGDGKISSMDYMLIKNKIMEVKDISGDIEKEVADVNKDGNITSLDYMLIKNDILGVKQIS